MNRRRLLTTLLGLLLCSALVFSGCITELNVDDDENNECEDWAYWNNNGSTEGCPYDDDNDDDDDDDKECEDWAYWNNNGSTEGCPYADDDDDPLLGSPVWIQVTSTVGMLGIAAMVLTRRAAD